MSDTTAELPLDGASPEQPQAKRPGSANKRARRVLAVVLVLIVALLGVSTYMLYRAVAVPQLKGKAASATDVGKVELVRSIYGISNTNAGLFGRTNVAVPDASGDIWVTDTKRASSIMHFTSDGKYIGELRSTEASSQLMMPSRIAFGPDGLMYIVETTQDRVRVMDPQGKDVGSFTVPKPVSIAVSDDRIVVGAVAGFAVLDKTGKPMGVVGARGKGADEFDYVHGVAIGSDGAIFVSDSYNNRLSAYEPDGKLRWRIRTGSPVNDAKFSNDMLRTKNMTDTVLKGPDQLQLPLGMTIDGAGRVVVIDMYDNTVSAFAQKDGKFLGKWGDYGADDGQFFYPVSISYDKGRDWFTVADAMNERVQIIRLPGSSSGANQVASLARRTLSGPLRACLLPFLLVLLAFIVWFVRRVLKNRENNAQDLPADTDVTPDAEPAAPSA